MGCCMGEDPRYSCYPPGRHKEPWEDLPRMESNLLRKVMEEKPANIHRDNLLRGYRIFLHNAGKKLALENPMENYAHVSVELRQGKSIDGWEGGSLEWIMHTIGFGEGQLADPQAQDVLVLDLRHIRAQEGERA